MKIVEEEAKLESLFLTAKTEAKKFFNNDELYIEKYFKNPRHIEVQIMSGKNRTVHLGEEIARFKGDIKEINRRNTKSSSIRQSEKIF